MKLKHLALFFSATVVLSQCTLDLSQDCKNNLKNYPFPYSNGDKVEFKNETGSTIVETVRIQIENLGKSKRDDPGHYMCGGFRDMSINGFYYLVQQDVNYYDNKITRFIYFNHCYDFTLIDTIEDYNYRNTKIKAFHYIKTKDFSDSITKCVAFSRSEDYKLLDFSLRNNGTIEKWVLK